MTKPKSGLRGPNPIASQRDADTRLFEAIYDAIARRHEPKCKPPNQEFDFFGSMIRARRIFGRNET
jgi:hypothetical protein